MMQNSTQTHTANTFYPSSPVNPVTNNQTIKLHRIDGETKHQAYSRLIELLSNPKIKDNETGVTLPFILHAKTKDTLMSEDGFSIRQIAELETRIIKDAEYSCRFEVARDAPTALYFALQKADETYLVFENQIVPLPNEILNALVCTELQREFGRKVLLACDGFIEISKTDEAGIIHKAIRLNDDGWVIQSGFMLPVYRNGLITALKIFRNHRDERPFRLQSRSREGYQ